MKKSTILSRLENGSLTVTDLDGKDKSTDVMDVLEDRDEDTLGASEHHWAGWLAIACIIIPSFLLGLAVGVMGGFAHLFIAVVGLIFFTVGWQIRKSHK